MNILKYTLVQTNFIIKNKIPRIKSLGDNITSHHTMGAFFSSQDLRMVQQEGNDTNCFVSLVVDTKGTYVAIVTRKVQTMTEVTVKHLGKSYEFFGEGNKQVTDAGEETTKVVEDAVIEYFNLEVERHEVVNTLSYLDDRFVEIESKKPIKNNLFLDMDKGITNSNYKAHGTEYKTTLYDWCHNGHSPEPKENSLFPEQEPLTKEDTERINDTLNIDWTPDATQIHAIVVRILTCSLIINPEKVDLDQWVAKHMNKVYERIFSEAMSFDEWRDFIMQFSLDHFETEKLPDAILDNYDVFLSRVATAIGDELSKYLNMSPYIQDYLLTLNDYIIE